MRWERTEQEEIVGWNEALMKDGSADSTNESYRQCACAPGDRSHGVVWPGRVLSGRRTVHATFKLSALVPTADASSTLDAQTDSGNLVKAARLIIWDEAPTAPRAVFDAVEKTCRYLFQRRHQALRWQGRPARRRLPTDPSRWYATPPCRRSHTSPCRPRVTLPKIYP